MRTFRIVCILLATLVVNAAASAQSKVSEKSDSSPQLAILSIQPNATIAASASYLFIVVSNNGLARLNLTNGGIQFCQLTTDSFGRPTSRCVKVGSFPTDNLASAQMTSVPGHVVVTNTATGVMVDCAVVINTNFMAGVPSGSCMTLAPGS